MTLSVNFARLRNKIDLLGEVGSDEAGGVCRLAFTDEDRQARDQVVGWMQNAGLRVQIDQIGNIFGIRDGLQDVPPIMTGSHIDTVRGGGKLDGPYGVLAGIELAETLNDHGIRTERPIVVAVFSNEEGARFQPDMMGSLVHAGGLAIDDALSATDQQGISIRQELARIGYAGTTACGEIQPFQFVELHIEQGPVLETEGLSIGIVENLQGISWAELTLIGQSNHAGTTPMALRRDAGYGAGAIIAAVRDITAQIGDTQVGTVGKIELAPNIINVVPGRATLTVDLRNSDAAQLQKSEKLLGHFLLGLAEQEGLEIQQKQLVRFDPVKFDPGIVDMIEQHAGRLGQSCKRMTSGAGHDAQMMARICPSAMIFVPSRDGVSHNPAEYTDDKHLENGANLLLNVVLAMAETS